MKIETSGEIPANAKRTRGGLRRVLCSLCFAAVVVAAIGAVASLRANQASLAVGNALPVNIIVVTNTNDSGPGSLRQALADANDGDTIDATGVSGTILLTSGELRITHNVTINGPGAGSLAVNGNATFLVFDNFVNFHLGAVTISGLTITNGNGGIFNFDGALTVSNCTVSGNSGGGIFNEGFNGGATLTVTDCTVSGNSADYGGGIVNEGFDGGATLTVTNCTISGNSAGVSGGGIYSAAGGGNSGSSIVTVSNSTISDNSAGDGNGGGIYNSQQGGGATLELGSTILNAGASGENIFNVGGTVTSLGYNLSSDNGGGYLTGTGDQVNTDPLLGPLQDNGGPTFTHALLPGSPAINAGDPSFTPPPLYDQRGPGFDRVVNGRIDIGSFEVQGPTLSARGYKVQGRQMVDLSWNGANSSNIDIYRNGVLFAIVPNIPGFYTDHIGARGKGTYTYRVCGAGTQNCSNQVTVKFGGG